MPWSHYHIPGQENTSVVPKLSYLDRRLEDIAKLSDYGEFVRCSFELTKAIPDDQILLSLLPQTQVQVESKPMKHLILNFSFVHVDSAAHILIRSLNASTRSAALIRLIVKGSTKEVEARGLIDIPCQTQSGAKVDKSIS